MKFRYFGQNGFQIDFNGFKLVIDPFISGNPSIKEAIDPSKIEADYILLTHGHGDHSADVELIAKANDAVVITNFEISNYYNALGIKTHGMNHGGKYQFDFGTVKYVNAVHTSSMPDGSYAGYPGGFVVWSDNECFYNAGDTALTMDMKLIPMTCPKLDVALLPIGDNYTMGYEDARIASDFISCDNIIGCHFDTFPVIKIDKEKAVTYFEEVGKKLHLLGIDKSLEI